MQLKLRGCGSLYNYVYMYICIRVQEGNPCSSSSDAVTEYNRIDFDDQNEYTTFYSSEYCTAVCTLYIVCGFHCVGTKPPDY